MGRMTTTKDATRDDSRQCIGCKCHRVPWNQGCDYCAACLRDDEKGTDHERA